MIHTIDRTDILADWFLEFYILVTFMVISVCAPTHDNTHSW